MKAAKLTAVDDSATKRAEIARKQADALEDLQALIEVGRLAGCAIEHDVTPATDRRSYPDEEFGRYFDIMRRIFYDNHLTDVQSDLRAMASTEAE